MPLPPEPTPKLVAGGRTCRGKPKRRAHATPRRLKPKALVSWSSGKDSAFALHEVQRAGALEIAGLLTTVNQAFERVAMHAVRVELLRRQAAAAGLPLAIVEIPWPCPNAAYEAAMAEALRRAHGDGITHVVFGDL